MGPQRINIVLRYVYYSSEFHSAPTNFSFQPHFDFFHSVDPPIDPTQSTGWLQVWTPWLSRRLLNSADLTSSTLSNFSDLSESRR